MRDNQRKAMFAKLRWYLPRSTINTNQIEANRIANELRENKRFKAVRVVKRVLPENKATKTRESRGYWVKVIK